MVSGGPGLILMSIFCLSTGSYTEDLLMKRLLIGYNTLIRPIDNQSQSIQVELGFSLVQVLGVEEVNQVMRTNVWISLGWQDNQLGWEPVQHEVRHCNIVFSRHQALALDTTLYGRALLC